ncbi:ankyrin repeat domain-containing protein 42-like isoform X1 [Saccoglossus kowalevskii]
MNSAGETPKDIAKRFAQLSCIKLLGEEDSDHLTTNTTSFGQQTVSNIASHKPALQSGFQPMSHASSQEILDDIKHELPLDAANPYSDDGQEGYDDEDKEEREERRARKFLDHGSTDGESVKLAPKQKHEARGRAAKRIEELMRLLEISKQNFHQLGGRLDEDKMGAQRDRESDRIIQELEAQLEYERLRRERLESQLDESRAEISHLNLQLEKALEMKEPDSTRSMMSEDENKTKKRTKKKTRPASASGVFVRRNVSKPAMKVNADIF